MFYDDYRFNPWSRSVSARSHKVETILYEEVRHEVRCGPGRCAECACTHFIPSAIRGANFCECGHSYNAHGEQ